MLLLKPEGATLTEIAAMAGKAPAAAFHALRGLVQDGLVERVEATRPVYRAKDHFSAVWIVPSQGRRYAWSTDGRISWRFPLVSRLPDERARQSVTAFLGLAQERGLFTDPHNLTAEARRGSRATKP